MSHLSNNTAQGFQHSTIRQSLDIGDMHADSLDPGPTSSHTRISSNQMSGKQPSGTRNALENTTRNGARHDPREPRRPHWITEDYYEENPWHNQNKYKPVFSLGQPLPRMVRWSRRESQNNGTKPNDDLAELGEVSSAGTSETESEASHKLRARHHHQTPAGVTLGGRFNDAGQPVHEYTPSNNQQGHARSGIEKQKNDGPDFGIDSEPLGKRETDEAEKPNSDLNDYRNWWARFRAKHPEPLAEFLATFAGIFLGLAGNLSVNLSANQNQQYGTYETSCWAWGFAWMFGIYLGGGVSGAHMNPAISVSLSVFRGFPWRQCGIYIFAQFIASFAAAALVYGVYQDAIHYADPTMESTANSLFSSPNTSVSLGTACFSQIVGSAIMMVAVFALGDDQNNPPGAGMHALILGLLVTTLRFTLGYNIGSSFNPASDFGPRVITYAFGYREAEVFSTGWWIYGPWLSTLAGSIIGCSVYDSFIFVGSESPINYCAPERHRKRVKRMVHLEK